MLLHNSENKQMLKNNCQAENMNNCNGDDGVLRWYMTDTHQELTLMSTALSKNTFCQKIQTEYFRVFTFLM